MSSPSPRLYSNFDRIPPGVSQPLIKVRSIDNVPIMALTLWGKNYDSYRLRRVAGEMENSLKKLMAFIWSLLE